MKSETWVRITSIENYSSFNGSEMTIKQNGDRSEYQRRLKGISKIGYIR